MPSTERLFRYLRGELAPPERDALRARLAAEPDLRARLDRLAALDGALAASAADGFAPGFAERVGRRLRPTPTPALGDALAGLFPRLAFACLLAAAGLAAWGSSAEGYGSALEAAFGLPEVDDAAVLYLDPELAAASSDGPAW